MVTPVSNVQVPQDASQAASQTAPVAQTAAPVKPQPATTDTVQISNAARQALQETIETPAQTAKEAAGGDVQARRLLAREAADKAL